MIKFPSESHDNTIKDHHTRMKKKIHLIFFSPCPIVYLCPFFSPSWSILQTGWEQVNFSPRWNTRFVDLYMRYGYLFIYIYIYKCMCLCYYFSPNVITMLNQLSSYLMDVETPSLLKCSTNKYTVGWSKSKSRPRYTS